MAEREIWSGIKKIEFHGQILRCKPKGKRNREKRIRRGKNKWMEWYIRLNSTEREASVLLLPSAHCFCNTKRWSSIFSPAFSLPEKTNTAKLFFILSLSSRTEVSKLPWFTNQWNSSGFSPHQCTVCLTLYTAKNNLHLLLLLLFANSIPYSIHNLNIFCPGLFICVIL